MADAVAEAIEEKRHLVVEAGTGVGKSFAYLVPAILAATESQDESRSTSDERPPRRRVIVSTNTISLQEQLADRDIPLLQAVLPREFSAVLAKGRGNYLSRRRMEAFRERGANLLETSPIALNRLVAWANGTTDGSRASMQVEPPLDLWDEVRSEHGNCLGRRCSTYDTCFYYQARRRLENADVVVVNHALFFSDLALRREGASILPDYDTVILDEAHTIESVASTHLGLTISEGQFTYALRRLHHEEKHTGLLDSFSLENALRPLTALRQHVTNLFATLDRTVARRGVGVQANGHVQRPLPVENEVTPASTLLGTILRRSADDIETPEQRIELTAAAERIEALGDLVQLWLEQRDDDSVYWVERGRRSQLKLMAAPIEVGPALRRDLFGAVSTVVLASATLTAAGSFEYLRQRLGLEAANELQLGSPFDYQQQAELVLQTNLPDPSTSSRDFAAALPAAIQRHVAASEGGVFVLFTSHALLRETAASLAGWMRQNGRELLVQGEGMPRGLLLERFRAARGGVLFGAETFWQGVDVPGEALATVIITRLPFSVPDHPLLKARLDRIRERGGHPFMEHQVPEAAIKLKQGFGRLIRTATDRGRVVILDPRVRTKRYGQIFLDSLPNCRLVEVGSDARA